MGTLRFWGTLVLRSVRDLFRQGGRAAAALLLCLALPLGIGPAADALLSQGISFSGITLAVTAPEGDNTPALLVQYLGTMQDIKQYCTFQALSQEEAAQALERGEVSAVLTLPEQFLQGVMNGTNPSVLLTVPQDRPLQSLLTLWVGQSAADMLAAAQAAVYAVLDLYRQSPPEGLSFDNALIDINLRCIQWVLNRGNTFTQVPVSATGTLPIPLHYGLSILGYLGLTAAPLFSELYRPDRLEPRRRLRALGRSPLLPFAADLTASVLLLWLLLAPALALLTRSPLALAAALPAALVCGLFGALCCLLCQGAAGAAGTAFSAGLVFLALSGGILPPVLLPSTLRSILHLSPVSWIRSLGAWCAGYQPDLSCLPPALVFLVLAALLCALLYRQRVQAKEAPV